MITEPNPVSFLERNYMNSPDTCFDETFFSIFSQFNDCYDFEADFRVECQSNEIMDLASYH